jgi:hypothetical protein
VVRQEQIVKPGFSQDETMPEFPMTPEVILEVIERKKRENTKD